MKPIQKVWVARGPSGPMETTAPTRAAAIRNLRYRLVHECHMHPFVAKDYDLSDTHEE